MMNRICVVVFLVVAASVAGCGRGLRVIETAPALTTGDATVTGIVKGPGDKGVPLANRTVVAVSQSTGERYSATTTSAGGYTVKVPPGRYTFEVALLSGESLGKGPGEVELSVGDIETRMDFQLQLAKR